MPFGYLPSFPFSNHAGSAPSNPPPLPARSTSTLQSRQAACTHVTMTRVYDNDGHNVCQICLRHPKTGWLYRCTQDYDGKLPNPDSSLKSSSSNGQIRQSEDPILDSLSPWVQKAIEDGHYTDKQIKILKDQKLGVKKAVIAMEEREANLALQEQDSARSPSMTLRPLIPRTTTLPPTLCRDTTGPSSDSIFFENTWAALSALENENENENALGNETSGNNCQPAIDRHNDYLGSLMSQLEDTNVTIPMSLTAPGRLDGLSENNPTNSQQIKTIFPPCDFITCHTCRPTFRERATLPLNQVLHSEASKIPVVPEWELKNRRISSARIVQRLGLARWLQSRKPLIEQMSGCSSQSDLYLASNTSLATDTSRRTSTGEIHQGRHQKWVDRWQKTFKKVVDRSRRTSSTHSSASCSQDDETEKPEKISHSMMFQRKRKVSAPVLADVETAKLKEAMYYHLGVNTPLPCSADDSEHIEGGEVEVEDGVAVTEEGVTLSTADIILQA